MTGGGTWTLAPGYVKGIIEPPPTTLIKNAMKPCSVCKKPVETPPYLRSQNIVCEDCATNDHVKFFRYVRCPMYERRVDPVVIPGAPSADNLPETS
jgi:hypothetical protein